MDSNIQTPVHATRSGQYNSAQQREAGYIDGNNIYNSRWHNQFKMAEALRFGWNIFGGTTYFLTVLSILTNMQGLLSALLALFSLVFVAIKCGIELEKYLLKRWERKQREKEQK